MLINVDAVKAATNVRPSAFYRPQHAAIFTAILGLYELEEPVDPVTVAARLNGRLGLNRGYLLELQADTPASANAKHYAELVTASAHRREAITLAGELATAAYTGLDWTNRANDLLEHVATNGVIFDQATTIDLVDLGPIVRGEDPEVVPYWLRRNDGAALLYPGKVHDLHGEPSTGKSWAALCAVREVLEAGGNALYLDYEDSPRGIVNRLLKMGTDPDLVLDQTRFGYIRPEAGLGAAERAKLHAITDELAPDLVIIDGVANALAADGYDENSNPDVVAWGVTVPRPLARRGATVLMIDHVSGEHVSTRKRGARGATAKLAFIDGASFEVRLGQAFSRRREGFAKIIVSKDREGAVGSIGETVAHARIVPHDDGNEVGVFLEAAPVVTPGDFKPTGLMARISEHLRLAGTPQSSSLIFDIVHGRREHLRQALALLIVEGHVEELREDRRKVYRHLKTYREDQHLHAVADLEEPDEHPDDPGPEPPPELF